MPLIPIVDEAKIKKLTDEPKFGTVVDNNDPDKLGKIKVTIPGIFEGTIENLPWVRRKNDTAFCGDDTELFDVPAIRSVVEVKWNYDENTPMYSGAPCSSKHMTDLFKGNYPFEGGFRFGKNYIKFDKEKPELIITNGDGNIITLSPEGKTTLKCKNLDIQVEETTNMSCKVLNINATSSVNVTSPTSTFNGNAHITGTTTDDIDVIANGISLVKHTHNYNPGPGSPAPTTKPN
jgi:hypothetical protein